MARQPSQYPVIRSAVMWSFGALVNSVQLWNPMRSKRFPPPNSHRAAGICGPHTHPSALRDPFQVDWIGCLRTRAMNPQGFEFPRVSGNSFRRGASDTNGRGQV